MFLAFPRPQNILGTIIMSGTTPADFAVILVHSAFTKTLFSKVSACLNFYFS